MAKMGVSGWRRCSSGSQGHVYAPAPAYRLKSAQSLLASVAPDYITGARADWHFGCMARRRVSRDVIGNFVRVVRTPARSYWEEVLSVAKGTPKTYPI